MMSSEGEQRPRKRRKKLDDYEVGYCRPPIQSRWKAGVSGNPAGKAKKKTEAPTNILDKLLATIDGPVAVKDSAKTISFSEAVGMRLRNDVLAGTAKDRIQILKLLQSIGFFNTKPIASDDVEDENYISEESRRLIAIVAAEIEEAEGAEGAGPE